MSEHDEGPFTGPLTQPLAKPTPVPPRLSSGAPSGTTSPVGRPGVTSNLTSGVSPTAAAASPAATPPTTTSTSLSVTADEPDSGEAANGSVMRSSIWMGLGTLVSRVLGMLRLVALSWAIGAAAAADAFNTANTLPNNMFLLIGGGILNAVLVPQIVRAAKNADGGKDYIDRLLTLSILILGGATLLLTVLAPVLIHIYSDGWDNDTVRLATVFSLWFMPQVFFYGLYTIYGQVLNARNSFGPYMWAPAVNNIVAIAGILVYAAIAGHGKRPPQQWSTLDVTLLAATTTAGVVAQALVLLPVLRRCGYTWRPRIGWRGIGLRTAGTVAMWTFAGVVVAQLAFVVISRVLNAAGADAIAAGQPGSGRTVWDYAYLLFMLPHSLIAVSLVTAVFTRLSHQAAAGNLTVIRDDVSFTVRTCLIPTAFATTIFLVMATDISQAIFVRTPVETTSRYAVVALSMFVGLVPYSLQYLFQRVFYAFEDARTPFLIGVVTSVLWAAGAWWASAALPATAVPVAVGLLLSATSVIGVLLTLPPLRARIGSLDGTTIMMCAIRIFIACVVAGSIGMIVKVNVQALLDESVATPYVVVLAAGLVMTLSYLVALWVLRVNELNHVLAPLRSRLRR